MKRNILLPTDFSENAFNAINYALDMYKEEVCQFYILHAYSVLSYGFKDMLLLQSDDVVLKKQREQIDTRLAELEQRIYKVRGGNSQHIFKCIAVSDDPLDAIKKAIEDYDIEMVIMGTKGETNSSNIVYGSLAIQVMEKSRNCPVFVIAEDAEYKDLNEIVFPTSYKTHYKKRELRYLSDIAEKSGSCIRVLYVGNEADLTAEQLRHKGMLSEYFEGVIHTFHTVAGNDKNEALERFVRERGSDSIAFINKKHQFFGSIFSEPLVKSVTQYSKVPVLVMHDLRN